MVAVLLNGEKQSFVIGHGPLAGIVQLGGAFSHALFIGEQPCWQSMLDRFRESGELHPCAFKRKHGNDLVVLCMWEPAVGNAKSYGTMLDDHSGL
jgi:hypothetical protein